MDQVWPCSCDFVVNLPGRSEETATSAGCQASSKETDNVGHSVGVEGLDRSVSLSLHTNCLQINGIPCWHSTADLARCHIS
jgi:hypothetical protein